MDTHTIIWYLNGDENLSKDAKLEIDNPQNIKFVSVALIWEIAIKISLGKLLLSVNIEEFVETILESQINIMNIQINHLVNLSKLDYVHRDPFDRLIVSQAMIEKMVIISKDDHIKKYNVNTLW